MLAKRSSFIWRCLPVFIFLLTASLSVAGVAAAQTVAVSGTVRDNVANPLAGAEVRLIDSTQQVAATDLTDNSGLYELSITPGTYDVVVTPPQGRGFQTATVLGLYISTDTVLNFALVPPGIGTVSGQVLDTRGNGVPNASIGLMPAGMGSLVGTTTDENGRYLLHVTPGEYNLSLLVSTGGGDIPPNLPPYLTLGSQSPLMLTGSVVLDFHLPLKSVIVHVQDSLGAAVPNIGLTTNVMDNPEVLQVGGIIFGGQSRYPSFWQPAVTDSNGNATMWLFPSGNYAITATPPPDTLYATTTQYGVAVVENRTLTITLAGAITVSGYVWDALGNGVPNASVGLMPAGMGSLVGTTTDENGRYLLHVTPGEYNLSLLVSTGGGDIPPNLPPYLTLGSQSPLMLTGSVVLDFHLPLKSVIVHVQDSLGAAVPNIGLTTNVMDNPEVLQVGGIIFGGQSRYPSFWQPAVTDSNGNATMWLFPSGPLGNYAITATPPPNTPYATFTVHDVTVNSDMTQVIILHYSVPSPTGRFWIGLKNRNDQGTQFDLRSELYLNGILVSEGETLDITGITADPSSAKEIAVPFGPISNRAYDPGDVLSVRVLARIAANPDGSKCSGPRGSNNDAVSLRLYYDSLTRPSRLGALISSDPMKDYFLHSRNGTYFLDDEPPIGAVKDKDANGLNCNNGNRWKEIGTWSLIPTAITERPSWVK